MADMFQTKNIRKLNADLNKISRELIEKSGKQIKTEVGDTLLTGANDTRNDIIKSMRNTPRLKRKWTKATVRAEIFPVAKEANMAVVVVPIFAPIMIGIAFATVSPPEPTMPTTTEVVVEEL